MPRYEITNLEYLKDTISSLDDDFSKPWSNYPCLEWPRARCKDGYGFLGGCPLGVRAHRVAYKLHHGELPSNIYVLHRCDNPPCFRPIHMFLGNAKDNATDCISKGRWKKEPRTQLRGNGHPNSKLTVEKVLQIREMKRDGMTGRAIAVFFDLDESTISAVIHRKNWGHVP